MPEVSARRVLGPSGWIERGSVVWADERISSVGQGSATLDFEYLVPGFVDLQVNGHNHIDLAQASSDEWRQLSHALAIAGTTSWVPTLVSQPLDRYRAWLERAAQAAEATDHRHAAILGVHLEGPFLGGRPGAHAHVAETDVDVAWIRDLPGIVSVVTLAPERPRSLEAIEALVSRGIVASLGHTDASAEVAHAAFDRGATMLTHCFNATTPLHHRRPGIVGAALARRGVAVSLIADGHHVHPDMLTLAFRAKNLGEVVLVSDASGWAAGTLGDTAVQLVDGAPRTAGGGLAGSAITLHDAIRFVVERCDVPLDTALRAASETPARVLGQPNIGRIATGANADLVALDQNLNIANVWKSGRGPGE